MNIATRSTALHSSFISEVAPQLYSSNAIRQTRAHGLTARWTRVEGKLQCQWD
jgi:hypothetical protein